MIDKGIKELIRELLILQPEGGPVSDLILSTAVANLNSRYRSSGMSSQELWTQRDQVTGKQLPIKDREIIIQQHMNREKNHPYSEKCKAQGKLCLPSANVDIGTLVYVYGDNSKVQARKRYMVTSISGPVVMLRKFTEHFIGLKDIEAKLHEIYKVPSLDDHVMYSDDDASSDDEHFPNNTITPTSGCGHSSVRSDGDAATDEEESHDDTRSELEDNTFLSSASESDSDTSFRAPANIAPSTMVRERRVTAGQPPDRFGEWAT